MYRLLTTQVKGLSRRRNLLILVTIPLVVLLIKGTDDAGRRHLINLTPAAPPLPKDSFNLTQTALRARGPLKADDPRAIHLLRHHYLEGPADQPYNLREDWDMIYTGYKAKYPSWGFINDILKDLYAGGPTGFFMEAGALDGEFLSNTLQLERRLGWTGLLVEAEKESYAALRNKHRRAWSSRACLGSRAYPYSAVLTTFRSQTQRASWAGRGAARVEENPTAGGEGPGYKTFQTVQCFPPLSFLLAVNASHIDFFSLDVEGAEMDILNVFPFERVTVDVWVIEHVRHNATPSFSPSSGSSSTAVPSTAWYEDPAFIAYMEHRGYYLLDVFCHPIPDYVFVRRGSEVFRGLGVPRALWQRRSVCLQKGVWQDKANYNPRLHRDPRHWPRLRYTY